VDREAAIAAAAFAAVGVPAGEISCCVTAAEAAAAWRAGRCIAASRLETVLDLPFDILVEASGQPEAGAEMADAAIAHGKHVALVSKEVDSVVGPLLAARAQAKGLVCTPVDGDQPSLLIDLVTWAETLGMEILAAGKSSEYDFVYDPDRGCVTTEAGAAAAPGFGALWELGDRPIAEVQALRAAMLRLPTVAVPDLCEMGLVANATGLRPDVPGFHAPILRIREVPMAFDTAAGSGPELPMQVVQPKPTRLKPSLSSDFCRPDFSRYCATTWLPGASEVFTQGLAFRPRSTALRASSPAPINTPGLEVFVQEVMAAMTTSP